MPLALPTEIGRMPGRVVVPALRREDAVQFSVLAAECLRHLAGYSGYSPNTIGQYETTYRQFGAFLVGRGLTDDLWHFNDETVMGFAEWLAEHKVSTNTVRHRLTGLSTLAKFAMRRRDPRGKPRLDHNPAQSFDWPQHQRPETRFLYREELRAFLGLAVPLHEGVARALFVETGLRVSELIRANVGDLVEGPGARVSLSVTVKGRGRREERVHVPVSAETVGLLKDWLLHRNMPDQGEPLLVNSLGARWTRPGVTEMMRRLGEKAGITRLPVRPHVLRHTANVIARAAGLDPFVRSRLLNHRHPQSLERYEHLIPQELHEARDQARLGLARYLGDPAVPPMSHDYATGPDGGIETLRNDREAT